MTCTARRACASGIGGTTIGARQANFVFGANVSRHPMLEAGAMISAGMWCGVVNNSHMVMVW